MANVELSSEEIAIFQNADFLLKKNNIFIKMQQSFAEISQQYQRITHLGAQKWKDRCAISPKISKGEQYEGLPYMMLDYPRSFSNKDIFAIRSFFWWGNYFSISLLLTGESQLSLEWLLLNNERLSDWQIDISDTPWNHHWEDTDHPHLSVIDKQRYVPKHFFKLSKKLPLSQWQDMTKFYVINFQELWTAINCLDV